MTSFEHLGLPESLLSAIEVLGFEEPSEIQLESIPLLLTEATDFIGLAQTGTGKTAAFGLPLLAYLEAQPAKHTQALILAPTRELCQQITDQMRTFAKNISNLSILSVYGGAPIQNQIRALKNPQQLIVATPGRLIDLMERKAVRLDRLSHVVLDEADEMLNFGFKEDIDHILQNSPPSRKTWLFSATLNPDLKRIVEEFMNHPREVRLSRPNEVNRMIEHEYALVMPKNRTEALCRFLDAEPNMRGIVFCRTKVDTQKLADELGQRDYRSDALHGDLSQVQRDRVTNKFRRHELQVLIATDVAARGLDVQDLTHVFHLNIPDDFAYYTHRSGRTARAGKTGLSMALIAPRDEFKLKQLSQKLRIEFKNRSIPDAKDILRGRIRNWTDQILSIDTGKKRNHKLLNEVLEQLEEVSREELVHRMLILEFQKLRVHSDKDLNAFPEKRQASRYSGKPTAKGKKNFRSKRSAGPGDKSKNFKKRFKK